MVKTTVLTLSLSPHDAQTLHHAWEEFDNPEKPPFSQWQLRCENCTITCYTSGKTVFQGKDAELYASPFLKKKDTMPQAGSDEVGTGDYFGPVVVCACIVEEKDLSRLKELGVRDSKSLTDSEIRKIAPALMSMLRYSLLIVSDEKYNQVHARCNMNAIKARLHNQAYVNLSEKTELPKLKVIDQFTPEPLYYRYISQEKKIIRGIHFQVRAENAYPAVGSASIIARYAFLVSMDEMEKKYGMHFQKGAGSLTDQDAEAYVEKYGLENLGKVAKLHFKNTSNLKSRQPD